MLLVVKSRKGGTRDEADGRCGAMMVHQRVRIAIVSYVKRGKV